MSVCKSENTRRIGPKLHHTVVALRPENGVVSVPVPIESARYPSCSQDKHTVSGSIRSIPNTPGDPEEGLES